jgi:nitrogen fixation/metabolism regulation signal transduction histidine kinase
MSLRSRLIAVFVLATTLPLGLTLWITLQLLDRSLELAPLRELDTVTRSLQETGRAYYQQAAEQLRGEAASASTAPVEEERFELAGNNGDRLDYYVRRGGKTTVYSRPLGMAMQSLQAHIAEAREALETPRLFDVRGGFSRTLLTIAGVLWLAALAALIFLAARISRPVRELTQGLSRVASGDLSARVDAPRAGSGDELRQAIDAFNHMASQLQQARENLIRVTRLASWQTLARKMAHEVKNSLTPIRLAMEEIASRKHSCDPAFLEQAAQIVAEEVNTLERRVRAFSEFSSEPPVAPANLDINALIEERVAFLKAAHPAVTYQLSLAQERPLATADPDLVKGVLTNLLENAAQAVPAGGVVMTRTACVEAPEGPRLNIEVLDSGPGLSPQARATLFEPAISFKKGGMGLGLSIARRSALLCGGDLEVCPSELGGAGFRLTLPLSANGGGHAR